MNTAIKVDKISEKDIISMMTPTGANALSIDENNDQKKAETSTATVFYIPGINPSPDSISALLRKADHISDTKELFSLSKDDIHYFIKALFVTPLASSEEIQKFLDILKAIALRDTYKDSHLQTIIADQVSEIKDAIPELNSIIEVLLNPDFYAYRVKKENNDTDKTLFQIVSQSPYWDEAESATELRMLNAGKEVKAAISETLQNEQVDNMSNPHQEKINVGEVLEEANTLLSAFKDNIERNIRGLLPSQEEAYYNTITAQFNSARFVSFQPKIKDNKSYYEIVLFIPPVAHKILESNKDDKILVSFFDTIIAPLRKEYKQKISLQYRIPGDQGSSYVPNPAYAKGHKHKPSTLIQIKEKPEHGMQKLYNSFGVTIVPEVDYKKYFESFPATEKKKIDATINSIIKPFGDQPTLCVSPSHDPSFVYAAINNAQAWKQEHHGEKVIARTVPASQLIKLNQYGGQQYAAGSKAPNAFFKIQDYCDMLVVTDADEFLQGRGSGTFKRFFDRFASHVILVAGSDNIDRVPLSHKNTKNQKETEMRAPLAFSIISLPEIPQQLQYQELQKKLQQELAGDLFTTQKNIQFSEKFYNAIKTLSQGNNKTLSLLLKRVATICKTEVSEIGEKKITTELFMHAKQHKLFKTALEVSFDDVYQIVSAYIVPLMQQYDSGRTIGDFIVKDAIARHIVHLYTTPHGLTLPLPSMDRKELSEVLKTHGLQYTQVELKNFKEQALQGSEIASFKHLCNIIDQQIINKLLEGHIDNTISPEQKDPFANGKSS